MGITMFCVRKIFQSWYTLTRLEMSAIYSEYNRDKESPQSDRIL